MHNIAHFLRQQLNPNMTAVSGSLVCRSNASVTVFKIIARIMVNLWLKLGIEL